MTAVHWAVLCDHPDHTARLIKVIEAHLKYIYLTLGQAGADLSVGDSEQRTALHYAVSNASARCLKILVDSAGPAINQKDSRGRTPLHISIGTQVQRVKCVSVRITEPTQTSIELVNILLANPAIDVNSTDTRMTTPLHWFCCVALHYLSSFLAQGGCDEPGGHLPRADPAGCQTGLPRRLKHDSAALRHFKELCRLRKAAATVPDVGRRPKHGMCAWNGKSTPIISRSQAAPKGV